jgi:drug/metabolite transporter (DMT)-like permease
VVFWITVLLRGISLPTGRGLLGAVLFGLLFIGANAAAYWGLLRAPASLAGAIGAFIPLMTFFFAVAHRLERFRWRGLIGALVATAGILFGVVGGFGGAVPVLSVLALLANVTFIAEAAVVVKLFPKSHPMATNAVALTTGVPLLAIVSLLAGEEWTLPTTPNSWAAYGYLALIDSVGILSLALYVLSRWTASASSYAFLLIPVSSVVIAALLLGEVITISFVVGAALVIAGVWVGAIRREPEAADLTCPEVPGGAVC